MTPTAKPYRDIPGTFVFDAEHSRLGYHLNMFMMSLSKEANRQAFKADEAGYLAGFKLTDEQRTSILARDWNKMLALGGNVYYTLKLAACDEMPFEQNYALMAGMPRDEFRKMMLAGGRKPDPEWLRKEK